MNFFAVLAVYILIDHAAFQGAGSVQRQNGDQIGKAVGLHLLDQAAHPRRLKLKYAQSIRILQEPINFGIVKRQAVQIAESRAVALDVGDRLFKDRQRLQAEEIHFDEAEAGNGIHGKLGCDLPLFDLAHGDEIRQWLGGNDHSRRML